MMTDDKHQAWMCPHGVKTIATQMNMLDDSATLRRLRADGCGGGASRLKLVWSGRLLEEGTFNFPGAFLVQFYGYCRKFHILACFPLQHNPLISCPPLGSPRPFLTSLTATNTIANIMLFLRPLSTLFRAGTRPTVSANTSITTSGVINGSPSALLLLTNRSKHSATQVKRLFKKNPARLRIQRRNEQQLAATEGDASTTNTSRSSNNNNATSKIPQRSYPPVFKPTFLQNGWSAPPPADVEVPVYPFRVRRTGRKPFGAAGFLPVYRDVR